jgi:glycosyltransferase involved in cell wall biosynthesis
MVEGGHQSRHERSRVVSSAQKDEASRRRPTVTLLQTTIPHYRVELFEALARRFGDGFALVAGVEYFDPTIRLVAMPGLRLATVRNRFFIGRKLLWQSGAWKRSVGADVVIAELNPRLVSTWAVLLTRRLLLRPTILWGHAWSRRGPHSPSDFVRQLMRRFADAIIAYSETQARQLRARMPGRTIVAAPNALYARAQQPSGVDGGRMRDFLFVGRLVEAKKPDLLVRAFGLAINDLPSETNLVFAGDGPLRAQLAATAERSPARDRIRFVGEVIAPNALSALYADALASVVPGYAGLSLIQSFWFGVPNLIAYDEPHSPEIEAAVPGHNASFFPSDSEEALRGALVRTAQDRDMWIQRREVIARECAQRYSIESMVESIAAVVEAVVA